MKLAKEISPAGKADEGWQPSLRGIARKAREERNHRFGGLYQMLNQRTLRECFYRLRKKAASGVDGITFRDYEKNLDRNLEDLERRLKHKSYHARLVRRKYIPKGGGKLRPLGIPVLEDKLVQYGAAQILQTIYEEDFEASSYGYRPGLGPHDAVRELTKELQFEGANHVVEADIKGYFENIQWVLLLKMLEKRVHDKAFIGLIRKWLRAGILEEDGKVIHPVTGTPQGGVISPVLANVYLHYALDLWFREEVQRKNRGRSRLYRYADDFVGCFEREEEARAFEQALKERLALYGLEVAPEKTKKIRFGRTGGEENERFDFLGFEFRWDRSRAGKPTVKRRTSRKKLRASVQRFGDWIKQKRHVKLSKLMSTLRAKYRGYWGYYGIIGNFESLHQFKDATERLLYKWLNRRSQKRSLTWKSLRRVLDRFQMPRPRITESRNTQMPVQLVWDLDRTTVKVLNSPC